jgi:hypothetical protein
MLNSMIIFTSWGVTLLTSVDISTRAPWITQNEQHFVASEFLIVIVIVIYFKFNQIQIQVRKHELDAQMEGH